MRGLLTTVQSGVVATRSKRRTSVKLRTWARPHCSATEKSPERPIATLDQVLAIAANVPERHRLLVLLACFNSLRWGELAGLYRRHLDVDSGTIVVERAMVELTDGSLVLGPPKSDASVRVLTVPQAVMPEVVDHLGAFVVGSQDALVFVGRQTDHCGDRTSSRTG